ncbi:fibronectin type III domain-containing protein, partial [Patescibacteria group bacterium]|nr:fibronectin type III domain-containing protein [Patescibacteria group bacterium]
DKIQLYAHTDPLSDYLDVAKFRIYFSAPTVITASDTVQYASDKEEWVDLATYEKIKYLTIASSHTGTWRLTYDISTNRGGSEYEIRINGGAAIATNSTLVAYFTWDTNKSHDFSINLNTGDTVEIWGRSMLSSDFSGVKNFRIKFDESGGDTTPPLVSATYLPANPESTQTVNYTVNASDVSGIKEIGIIVDGLTKKTCLSTTTCNYVGGPYSEGTHNFTAYTYDNSVGLIYNSVSYSFMVITPGGSAVQSGCGVSYWESPTVYRSYNACIIDSNCPATIPGWIQSEIGYVGCDTYGCNSPSCGGCCAVVQIVWTKDPACDPDLGNPCNRNACGGTGVIQCDSTCSAPSPTLYGTADCNRNACGGTGVTDNCTGGCSAPSPTLYGTADCNRNACGGTGVTDNCTGGCSAPSPTLYGTADCDINACGESGNMNNCTGVCDSPPPPFCDAIKPTVSGTFLPSSPISKDLSINFSSNAADASGISLIRLLIDGTNVKTCNSLTTCSYASTSGDFVKGSHTYQVYAEDNSAWNNFGNSPYYSFTVTDNTPPNVSGSYLPTNPNTNEDVFLAGNASSVNGVKTIEIFVDSSLEKSCSGVTSCFSDGKKYSLGSHNLQIKAYDKLDILSTISYDFTVISANSKPSQVTGLTGVAGENKVTLTWDAPADGGSPISNYRIYRDGVSVAVIRDVRAYSNVGLNENQTYNYSVSAVNVVGEGSQSDPISKTPFVVLPVVSGSYSPNNPENNRTINFKGSALDDSGIAFIEIWVDGIKEKTCNDKIFCPYNKDEPYLEVGDHTFVVVAYDKNGNSDAAVYNFTVTKAILPIKVPDGEADRKIPIIPDGELKETESEVPIIIDSLQMDEPVKGYLKIEYEWGVDFTNETTAFVPLAVLADSADLTKKLAVADKCTEPIDIEIDVYLENVRYGTIKNQRGVAQSGNYVYVSNDFNVGTVEPGDRFNLVVHQTKPSQGCSAKTGIKNYRILFDYDDSCSANAGSPCNRNACDTGTINCAGECTVAEAPLEPVGFGTPCNINACGESTGTINCEGECTELKPAEPAYFGNPCNRNNACYGVGTGTFQCDGSCTELRPTLYEIVPCSVNECGFGFTDECTGFCEGVPDVSANGNDCIVGKDCNDADIEGILFCGDCIAKDSNTVCDNTSPTINLSHSPNTPGLEPNSLQEVTFTGNAMDDSGIAYMQIYVNDNLAKGCNDDECVYTGGPFPEGTDYYYTVIAWDLDYNFNTATKTFNVYAPLNNPPTVVNLGFTPVNHCQKYLDQIVFSWDFDDTDENSQYAFKIDIASGSESCATSIIEGEDESITIEQINSNSDCKDVNMFEYGSKTYEWTVTVWDNNTDPGVKSAKEETNFGIPDHRPPFVDFTINPSSPKQFEEIEFNTLDQSICYDILSEPVLCAEFYWDFNREDNPDDSVATTTPADPNTNHVYSVLGAYTADLRVTDILGKSCWASDWGKAKNINIALPKPKWIEVW